MNGRERRRARQAKRAAFPYEYESHPLPGGGHYTVIGPVSPELIEALLALAEAARKLKPKK